MQAARRPARGIAARAFPALLLGIAAAVLFACSGAPPRPGDGEPAGAPLPPGAPERPPQVSAPPRPQEIPETRFLRVRLGGGPEGVILSSGRLSVWDTDGRLLAQGLGDVPFGAVGSRVRFDGTRLFGEAVDVGGEGGLRMGGRPAGDRLRVIARNGQLIVVAVVPLEAYVAAVISREAPPRFHPEALAAQAVATRTYAVGALKRPRDPAYDLLASVEDQVFEGVGDVAPVFREAAAETRGMVLLYRGEPARTVFHSTCGGRTETAENAWGRDIPYLRSQVCEDCSDSPVYRWEYRMFDPEARRVARALGVPAEGELEFSVAGTTSTGRATRVRIRSGGVVRDAPAAEFRRVVGYSRVRSLLMGISPAPGGWVISGRGYGHGVGMCQFGANAMARSGMGFREILARYYPGTVLSRQTP